MQGYKISAAVVVYNNLSDAEKTIGSILEYAPKTDFDLYVVDNASQENIGQALQQQFAAPHYIHLKENIGFGQGHNAVLPYLDSKYHFVINPDILINQETLETLCAFMDQHPEIAICCPKVLNPDNSLQYIAKRRPSLSALVARRIPLKPLKKIEDFYLAKDLDQDTPFEVDFCTGCFFVIRTEVYQQIKGFDPRYFLYFEDADITMEAKKYGKAYYCPDATVIHFWHRETAKSKKAFMTQLKSMFIYFKKWGYKL